MVDRSLSIAREFVGAVAHTPILSAPSGGYAVLIDGEYLHPLEGILDRNAAAGIDVTVLDLHRWNKSTATEFYAKVPSATGWYNGLRHHFGPISPISLSSTPRCTCYVV